MIADALPQARVSPPYSRIQRGHATLTTIRPQMPFVAWLLHCAILPAPRGPSSTPVADCCTNTVDKFLPEGSGGPAFCRKSGFPARRSCIIRVRGHEGVPRHHASNSWRGALTPRRTRMSSRVQMLPPARLRNANAARRCTFRLSVPFSALSASLRFSLLARRSFSGGWSSSFAEARKNARPTKARLPSRGPSSVRPLAGPTRAPSRPAPRSAPPPRH